MGKPWSGDHPAPSYTVFHVMPREIISPTFHALAAGARRPHKSSQLYKTTYTTLHLSGEGKKVASYKQMCMWTLPNAYDTGDAAATAAATWNDEGGEDDDGDGNGRAERRRGSRSNQGQSPPPASSASAAAATPPPGVGPPLRSPRRVRRSEDLRDATR